MVITTRLIEKCFGAYYRPLCLYAWDIVKSAEDAEDVVQGVFAEVLEECAAGKEREVEDVRRYLAACVCNAGRRWRRERMEKTTEVDVEELPEEEVEYVNRAEREARLWDWIDSLPRMQRDVLLAAKRDGLSYREIAERFGIAERTVAVHLQRAVRALRTAAVKVYMFFFG